MPSFRTLSLPATLLLCTLLTARTAASGTRAFTATLTKVPGCTMTAPSGSATLTIDDASGAVSGTLVLAGFDGATITSSGIHNKNAGDNLVGPFAGVDTSDPNKSHAVTSTLNNLALTRILAGNGAIIVKTDASGCTAGAARGDLVEGGAADAGPSPTDGGGTSPDAAGGSTPPDEAGTSSPDAAGAPSREGGDDDRSPAPGGETAGASTRDDGGCAIGHRTRGLGGFAAVASILAVGCIRRRWRRRR
jgi:hypothetical protein